MFRTYQPVKSFGKILVETFLAFLITVSIVTAVLLLFATIAYAHGDAEWIQNTPEYKMKNGSTHCCGPSHCRRMSTEEIRRLKHIPVSFDRAGGQADEGGWELDGEKFMVGKFSMYQHDHDTSWWICRNISEGGDTLPPHCLFEPKPET